MPPPPASPPGSSCRATRPPGSCAPIGLHGAEVIEVDGTIADAGRVAAQMVATDGFFDLSTLKEPYRAEGKKTMGYELWEQTGGDLPDAIVYPTGGGTGLVGIWKALDELEEMGLLTSAKRPRLISVQAAGCAPIVEAVRTGGEVVAWPDAHTFASGLRVPSPYAGPEVLGCLQQSGGTAIAVIRRRDPGGHPRPGPPRPRPGPGGWRDRRRPAPACSRPARSIATTGSSSTSPGAPPCTSTSSGDASRPAPTVAARRRTPRRSRRCSPVTRC